ncbi:MAG: hypothetical protein F2718_05080 [Actinobacteria bacterium]|uniref:Unannotated protein n=1 Tax=freshwater metagenome TaxID=449393 RepID=A0A6J7SM62_9ZZZZ|nr:hypothetical protein [Actinomycetota bacterium]MTA50752.1 hypothetical protein [Actinomycetota bacterium]MTB25807.1 hypothetical protein [Actinomycetota bacterium]
MNRVEIDPNIRVRGNHTYVGFEECENIVVCGDEVEVFEEESGLVGRGRVIEVDHQARLVFLEVDWSALSWWGSAQPSEERFA